MKSITILLLPLFLGALGCSDNSNFAIGSFQDALGEVSDAGGTIVDENGDGVPDGIDTNGDGTADVPFTPPVVTDPETGDPVPPDAIEDPVNPILRDDGDHCIPSLGNYIEIDGNADHNITAADVGSAESLIVSVSSKKTNVSINLGGHSIKRIIAYHMGNSNRITVSNTVMTQGFCNQMSGGSNKELLEDTSSAVIADLQSGTGGGNALDIRFKPSTGLRYQLSGNSQCISAPLGTTILSHSSNDNDHDELFDGTTCLP